MIARFRVGLFFLSVMVAGAATLASADTAPEPAPFAICQGTLEVTGWSDFHCPISAFVARKPIDLLWVIDNSGSMSYDIYHQNLIQNAQDFIGRLVAGNSPRWKLGVLSTTEGQAPYAGFTPQTALDWQSPNPVQAFQQAVLDVGFDGDFKEAAFTPIMQALEKFPDFLRPEASLGIVFASDEIEQSAVSVADFVNYLKSKKGELANVSTYGLFAAAEWGCLGAAYAGGRYEELLQATHGHAYPLCQLDPALFADIETSMQGTMRANRLDLPANVDPGHIELYYNTVPATKLEVGADYAIDSAHHQLVFTHIEQYDLNHHFILSFKVQ